MVHWSSLYTVLAVSVTYLMEHVNIVSTLDNGKKKSNKTVSYKVHETNRKSEIKRL